MMTPFTCSCGHQFQVPETDAGKQVRCPACAASSWVPASAIGLPIERIVAAAPVAPSSTHGARVGTAHPYSMDELRQSVASGLILPTDMVMQEGTQNWVLANSISGL